MPVHSLSLIGALLLASLCSAAEFHIDPVDGSPNGDGTAARPWKSLQGVIDRGLVESRKPESLPHKAGAGLVARNPGAPVHPGDTIVLHDGAYGDVAIRGYYNTRPITIAAAEGATPRFGSITIRSGANWILRGLHVSLENGHADDKPRALVRLTSHGHHGPVRDVTLERCTVQCAADTSGWSKKDWNDRTCNGIGVGGTRMTVRHNTIRNVNHGISVGATHSRIEHNVIDSFAGDGLRGLGNHTVFAHNTVKNCYDVNANHDDGFQSWSRTEKGVGTGKVVGVVLRANTIINYTDPDQPHRGTLQAIGCFDGFFEDWVIENNVIITDHWHGITLLGARNCRIVNNTMIDQNDARPGPPWIWVGRHKDGRPSVGCVVRNNITARVRIDDRDKAAADHNLIVTEPEALFVDPARFDLRPEPGSRAIDAGSADLAPTTDHAGNSRPAGGGVDIGAYEISEAVR